MPLVRFDISKVGPEGSLTMSSVPRHSFCCRLWLLALAAATGSMLHAQQTPPPPETLTTSAAVRSLSREQAVQRRPVRIVGTVTQAKTLTSSDHFSLMVQDETEGVWVTAMPSPGAGYLPYAGDTAPSVGTVVEVIGATAPGGHTPIVVATRIHARGTAPLPPAHEVNLTELRTGAYDSQRVKLSGVVQRTFQDEAGPQTRIRMEISAPDGVFGAVVADATGLKGIDLVDAEVSVTGPCGMLFNSRGECVGAYVQAATAADVTVIQPAPADPFSAPWADRYALRPYHHEPVDRHRRRIAGTVTLWRPGKFMYLQTEHRAYRLETHATDAFSVGDVVEAVGFVALPESFGIMTEALFRKTGHGSPPEPLSVTRSRLMEVTCQSVWPVMEEDYDGRLIAMKGRLVRIQPAEHDSHRIYLDCEGHLTQATLDAAVDVAALRDLLPGSDLRVTGVCALRLDVQWPALGQPRTMDFSLHLRSPDDIVVLSAPSWWTTRRLLWALGTALGVLILLALWNLTLRRTVAAQSGVIAERAAKESRLEERQRIGRDLHDTLQQELTGIGLLIGNSKSNLDQPDKALETLNMAERMVQRASEESRSSIHDLMSVTLENNGLAAAMDELVRPLAEIGGARFHTHLPARMPRLPARLETALLRIAHEAAANAGKHSKATDVHLTLEMLADRLRLVIQDNGTGFDVEAVRSHQLRHFGLLAMEERALKLGGKLHIMTQPDVGTTISAVIPTHHG